MPTEDAPLNLIRQGVRNALLQAKLDVDSVGLEPRSDGWAITASGRRKDGSPFTVATPPFQGDPIKMAEQVAAGLVNPPQGSTTTMSTSTNNPGDLVGRVRAMFTARDERINARLAGIDRDSTVAHSEADRRMDAALDRLETKIKDDDKAALDAATALEDEVNRLTNGGPA